MAGSGKDIAEAESETKPLLNGEVHAVVSYGTTPSQPSAADTHVAVDGSSADDSRAANESLDYELIESTAYTEYESRGDRLQHLALKWLFALLVGTSTGATAFLINMAVENIGGFKYSVITRYMDQDRYLWGFLILALCNVSLVAVSACLCKFVSPEAAGSGIPEVKAYLNGVDTPRIFAPKTLLVKVLGSIGSVAGGLSVGKEGPLVHTGSCIANIMGQGGSRKYHLTAKWLRYFKNDSDRRDLVTCGAAAGVAAAFRAPVGGVLFALEEVTSWWRSSLLWRVFFTNAVVAVTLKILMEACQGGKCGDYSTGGFIIFDNSKAKNNYGLLELVPVTILGILGGVLGSLFNYLNLVLNKYRQTRLPRTAAYQIAEACGITLLTAVIRYVVPFLSACVPCPEGPDAPRCPSEIAYKQFTCPAGHYNSLAGLLFTTNDDCTRNLLSTGTKDVYTMQQLLLFFFTFYPLSILTYGITVPSGIFVPAIICGATYGRIAGKIMVKLIGGEPRVDPGTYSLLGAASFLGGSMRMTVSLSIILLELTGSLTMLPLIMLTLLIAKTVGDTINHGIYDAHIRLKGIPYLEARPELFMSRLKAKDAVRFEPVSFLHIESVRTILEKLTATPHNAYPVIDATPGMPPVFYGLILRRHLLVLLKIKKTLQPSPLPSGDLDLSIPSEEFGKPGSGKGLRIEDIHLTEEDLSMYMDLRPFTNRSSHFVSETMSLSKVYSLFRQQGLRHLCVVPSPNAVVGVLTRKDLLPESFSERRMALPMDFH